MRGPSNTRRLGSLAAGTLLTQYLRVIAGWLVSARDRPQRLTIGGKCPTKPLRPGHAEVRSIGEKEMPVHIGRAKAFLTHQLLDVDEFRARLLGDAPQNGVGLIYA